MTVMSILEAKDELQELADRAESGEEVAIVSEVGRRFWLRPGMRTVKPTERQTAEIAGRSRAPGAGKG